MAINKKKKSKTDSRNKRLFAQRSKKKGHRIRSKQEVDEEQEKLKLEQDAKEMEQKEKLIEKKRKLITSLHVYNKFRFDK
jgi:hypothetical protein